MKHKRAERGFAHYLLLTFIIALVVTGGIGWIVYQRSHDATSDSTLSENDYVPRELSVIFKDGVTAQQALAVAASYNLTVEHPELISDDFTSRSYRAIKSEQFSVIQNKLSKYPEVDKFFDDSADPVNNRAGAGEKWVEVIWHQDVKYDRIKTILVASGLGLSNQPQSSLRLLYVTVPSGKENSYIKKLQKAPTVKSANRVGKPVLLNN